MSTAKPDPPRSHHLRLAERALKERADATRHGLKRGGKDAAEYVRTAQALMFVRTAMRQLCGVAQNR